jgi:hypothetical protein
VRRFRKIPVVAWAVFLAVFLPGVGGLGESVLCFGADGHVAVEAAVSPGACFSAPVSGDASAKYPERELSREGDHCGPCVDFPVLVNEIDRGVSSLAFHNANPAHFAGGTPATLAGSSMPGMSAGRFHSGIRHDLPDPTFISLRNTVLLI